jgi:hypothetical protein
MKSYVFLLQDTGVIKMHILTS